ncbi:MAG: hypothetical protein V4795_05165 [Pseudomonadota bacterium]
MADNTDVKQWADALDRLLQQAVAARQAGDLGRIADLQRQLRQFRLDSPDFADALDRQASLAIFDLDLSQTEEAVANIKARADEVQALTKLILGVAASAQADADVLGGKFAVQAIEAATAAIGSFKQLRAQLDTSQGDAAAIGALIDKTLASVQTLRNRLEKP